MPAGFENMIKVSIRADEIYQKQKQRKLQDRVGDLLEHSWHYDCVVSPKYNSSSNTAHHVHMPLPLPKQLNPGNNIKSSSENHHHHHHHHQDVVSTDSSSEKLKDAADAGSSTSSNGTAPSGSLFTKPLAIAQYPSLSPHESGYVSLATFINSSCNSTSNSLGNNFDSSSSSNMMQILTPFGKDHVHHAFHNHHHHHGLHRHHHHHQQQHHHHQQQQHNIY